jgi:hypothetical protein
VYGPLYRSRAPEQPTRSLPKPAPIAHSDGGTSADNVGADFVNNLRFLKISTTPAPAAFVSIYDWATGFRDERAHKWKPEVLEAMLLPMDAPETNAIPWPDGWPGFSSAGAKRPDEDHAGKIFLDGSQLEQAEAIVHREFEDREHHRKVLLDGRGYTLLLRIVIPGEQTWAKRLPSFH